MMMTNQPKPKPPQFYAHSAAQRAAALEDGRAAYAAQLAERVALAKSARTALPVSAEGLRRRACLPACYQSLGWADWTLPLASHADHPAMAATLATAQDYARRFETMQKRGTGLIFYGNTGTGKTMLACILAAALMEAGKAVRYSTGAGVIRLLRSAWRKSGPSEAEVLAELLDPPLLIIDELESLPDDTRALKQLEEVIDERYQRRAPIHLITNLSPLSVDDQPSPLQELLGDRIHSRLLDAKRGTPALPFTWADLRRSDLP